MSASPDNSQSLNLFVPDWSEWDTVWRNPAPFILWQIGELPLLYHWLDYAINTGCRSVCFYVIDRPSQVREALERATLWPIDWEVIAVRAQPTVPTKNAHTPPWTELPAGSPHVGEGWDMLHYRHMLEQSWLEAHRDELTQSGQVFAVGHYCQIDPSAHIEMPCWIGDYVSIGPDVRVGAGSVIGDGCILAEGSELDCAHLTANTFLGHKTSLSNALLDGGLLLNLTHQARICHLESYIVGRVCEQRQRPPLHERFLAFWLWLWFGLRGLLSSSPEQSLGITRRAKLLDVVSGQQHLFGIFPRPVESLAELPVEWRSALQAAPVGVFSLADTHGCHHLESSEEVIHAVYQAVTPQKALRPILQRYLWRQLWR